MARTSITHGLITLDQEEAWFALLSTHAALTHRVEEALMEKHGLSFSEFEILCRLKLSCIPLSVRALADRLVTISRTRASRVMQELINGGYLMRSADQADGRVSLISFTPEGHEFARVAARTFEEAVRRFFVEPLDEEDIAAILRIWKKLDPAQQTPDLSV